VHVLSVREAMGGLWAGNVPGWLILFVPTTVLVVLQETTIGASGWAAALVLAVLEHLAAGLLVFAVVWALRRRWRVIPIGLVFAMWIGVGVVRGLVWSAWHAWVLHTEADVGYRVLVWVAISLVWSPLFTYTLAQLDHRRTLLGELTAVRLLRATERARVDQSARERREHLIATVQSTIGPVISELHRSLTTIAPRLTRSSVTAMAKRVSSVAYDTSRLVAARGPEHQAQVSHIQRAPISAALDFPPDRPLLASALAGVAMLPLAVPDTLRVQGFGFALRTILAISVMVLLLALSLAVLRFTRIRFGRPSLVALLLAFLIPGAAGSVVIALTPGWPPISEMLSLLILLPVGSAIAGANVATAVGLAHSNEDLAQRVEAIRLETDQLVVLADESDLAARIQLEELLHGPVYGRLSACVMALNFHAEELASGDDSRSESITSTVLEYLDAASRDLDALSINRQ